MRKVVLAGLLALMMLPLSPSSTTTVRLQVILKQYTVALETVEDGLKSLKLQLAIAENQLSESSQELIELRAELSALQKWTAILKGRLLRAEIASDELKQLLKSSEKQIESLTSSYESYKKRITGEIQELLRKERGKRILWVTISGLVGAGLGALLAAILG